MRSIALVLKPIRFELLAVGFLCAAVAAWALYVLVDVSRLGDLTGCLHQQDLGLVSPGSACDASLANFDKLRSGEGAQILAMIGIAPYLVGLTLGVTVVAREIEQETAALSWALAGSRGRWLRQRLVRLVPVAILMVAPLVVLSELLESYFEPTLPVGASFVDWGSRGIPLFGYCLVAFALATLVGSVLGRVLPALIVAGVLCVAVQQAAHPLIRWAIQPEAGPLPTASATLSEEQLATMARRSLSFGEVAYDKDGARIPDLAAWLASHPPNADSGHGIKLVEQVIGGDAYLAVEMLELAGLVGMSLAALIGANLAVANRRPY